MEQINGLDLMERIKTQRNEALDALAIAQTQIETLRVALQEQVEKQSEPEAKP